MRDVKTFVREHIATLGLPADEQVKIAEELTAQLEEIYEALLARGMSEDEAWRELESEVPSWRELRDELVRAEPVAAAVVRIEHSRPGRFLATGLGLDLRASWRSLRKHRGFSVTAIVTLAVCLGANAVVFAIVDQGLLNPLAVPEPDRIMVMANQFPNTGAGVNDTSAPRNYYDRLSGVTAFSEQALLGGANHVLTLDGATERLSGMSVTPSLFRLLGISPALGRAFTEEEQLGNEQRVILSHGLWQQLYAGDRAAVGTEITLSGRPFTIVGVMPESFSFFDPYARFWMPLTIPPNQRNDPLANFWYSIGRLETGATREQAQQQVDATNAAMLEEMPQFRVRMEEAGFHTTVFPLEELIVRNVRPSLYALWAGALFVVLIGAVNLANLALAQSRLCAREQALRMTLGAGRPRVARLLALEGLTITAAGGVLGVVLGAVALRVVAVGTPRIDRFLALDRVGLDWKVVGFVLALALVSGLFVVLASLAHVKSDNLADVLRQDRHTGASGEKARTIRRTLVVAQVALAFVLVVGAALLFTTVRNLLNVDAGFSRDNIVTGTLPFEGPRYDYDQDAVFATIDGFLERIRSAPGVVSAGATTLIPLSGGRVNVQEIFVEGNEQSVDEPLAAPWAHVTPGFFETMSTPLVRGRYFDERDNAPAPGVVIVDERLANRLWPDTDPIGKRLFMPGVDGNAAVVTESTKWLTVVGVVPEVRLYGFAGSENPLGSYYTPHRQWFHRYYTFAIKSPLDPAIVMRAVRAELAALDPELVPFQVQTMAERTDQSLARERLAMGIAVAFGGVALFLSALGIYGVLAYLVAQRSHEIGVRMALGSTVRQVFALVLREGLVLVAFGLVLGVAGIALLGRALQALVYGVAPTDPVLIALVAVLLAGTALAASVLPARRATRVNPIVVLNAQ